VAYITLNVKHPVVQNNAHIMTSPYGHRTDPITGVKNSFHGGIDLRWVTGADIIIAFADGKVTVAKDTVPGLDKVNNTAGNYIEIDHGNGWRTRYLHLKHKSVRVKVGDTVKAGQAIATMGTTGYSTGVHLHFEIRRNGERLDPRPYLEGKSSIAGTSVPKPPVTAPVTYKVVKGDNLTKIARQFGTNVSNLVKLNNIKDPDKISVGQVLKLK